MQESLIKKITVQASETGVSETLGKVDALARAEADLGKAQRDRAAIQATVARQRQSMNQVLQQQVQVQQIIAAQAMAQAAANDNLSKSIDHAANSGSSFGGIIAKLAIGAAATALGIGALYLAFKIMYGIITIVPRTLGEAWALGTEKIAEYVDIAKKAAAVDLSTGFFQRITKAATDAKLPVDDLNAALKALAAASADKLGGSDLQNRIDASVKAGNFQGNSGVGALASANNTEEKFRAVVSLIDQAMQKGERLAALDISSKAFGPAVTANLTKDSEYLKNMLASADKIAATELVSDADIGRALDLQNRWAAAVAILETRWHPIQGLLTAAGIAMHEIWVNIVSAIADAVDQAARLIGKLGEAPSWFQKQLDSAGKFIVDNTTTPESRKASEQALGISSDPADIAATVAANAYTDALGRLGAGLKNVNAVQQAVATVNAVQAAVWKDTSHAIDDAAKKVAEARDQYDRAKDSIEKHISRTLADRDAVGLGAGALEEFRAKASLTTAAMLAGIRVVGDVAKQIDDLAKKAGAAGDALARANIANGISFNRQTALLAPDDVQIATQLKTIYPDVATALGSVEASAIRVNDTMKGLSSSLSGSLTTGLADIFDGTKSVSQGFADMRKLVIRAIEEMIIKIAIIGPMMRALQASVSGSGILSFLTPAASSVVSAAPTSFAGAGTPMNILPPGYANGGMINPGAWGVVGEKGPELVRVQSSGVTVYPNHISQPFLPHFADGGMLSAFGNVSRLPFGQDNSRGGASWPKIEINNHSGGEVTTSRKPNGDLSITVEKMVDTAVGKSMSNGTGRRVLAGQYGVKPFTGQ
jgi:hypothetical protein